MQRGFTGGRTEASLPSQETTKVKTRYKGKTIPKEIRVEIFPSL